MRQLSKINPQYRFDYLGISKIFKITITFPFITNFLLKEENDLVINDRNVDFPAPDEPMIVRKSPFLRFPDNLSSKILFLLFSIKLNFAN